MSNFEEMVLQLFKAFKAHLEGMVDSIEALNALTK